MSRLLVFLFIHILFTFSLSAQSVRDFRIMEYNVENLFDTLHTEGKADADFTPSGNHRWTSSRYWGKLGKTARLIAAVGEAAPVDLVALVEIENDSVAHDLTQRTLLRPAGYQYLITNGPDVRGINVALLYLPHRFRPIGCDTLRFVPPSQRFSPTRDALHVWGELPSGDTLDILVCHLPSRRNGNAAAPYRITAAKTLRSFSDSILTTRLSPLLILTGDYNASYPDKIFTEHIGVLLPQSEPVTPRYLYILSSGLKGTSGIEGTYKYKGRWQQLDHFIVNGQLLKSTRGSKGTLRVTSCRIADFPFLLEADKSQEGVKPHRTYLGNYYHGGYSDHLPLVLDLQQ